MKDVDEYNASVRVLEKLREILLLRYDVNRRNEKSILVKL